MKLISTLLWLKVHILAKKKTLLFKLTYFVVLKDVDIGIEKPVAQIYLIISQF